MRGYFFTNMYLSAIQKGIQPAHCLGEMSLRYLPKKTKKSSMLKSWLKNHKTMIVLDGGFSSHMEEVASFFKRSANPYPWAQFHEGVEELNGALTCVGIILPEKVYAASSAYRVALGDEEKEDILINFFSKWERELIQNLGQYRLAM